MLSGGCLLWKAGGQADDGNGLEGIGGYGFFTAMAACQREGTHLPMPIKMIGGYVKGSLGSMLDRTKMY